MRHTEINECWQEGGPDFFLFPPPLPWTGCWRAWTREQGRETEGRKGLEEGGKSTEREAVIEAIQHWWGRHWWGRHFDKLHALPWLHGLPACHPFLAFTPTNILAFERQRKDTKGRGAREKKAVKRRKTAGRKIKMKMDKKETNEIRIRRYYNELWV